MFFILRFFWNAVGPARKWLLIGNALQILVSITELSFTWLLVQAVSRDDPLYYVLGAILLLSVRLALNRAETATTQGRAKVALEHVGEAVYRRLIVLDVQQQLDGGGSTHLSYTYEKVKKLFQKVESAEYNGVFVFSGLLIVLTMVALEDVLAAAVFAGWVMFIMWLVWRLSKGRIQRVAETAEASDAVERHVAETFSSIRHIAGYGKTRDWWRRMEELSKKLREARRVVSRKYASVSSLLYFMMDGVLIGIVVLGFLIGISQELQLFLLMYFIRMTKVISGFHVSIAQLQEVAASAHLVREALEARPSVMSPDQPLPLCRGGGASVELRNVRLSFGQQLVLHDVSLSMAAGSVTAVIGKTGSGKSTLLALIQRLMDPDEGKILVEGQDVAELDVLQHRQRLGWVSQDPHIFSGSIRDNARLLCPGASDDDIWRALASVGLEYDVREHPERLNASAATALSSGGQKQRLEAARIILADVDVVLLDEPTSALDNETAHQVVASILKSCRETGKTVIFVTHDLELLQYADQVLEVAEGKVRPIR